MRGRRDFESVDTWQAVIDETLRKANTNRSRRVDEDLVAMRELNVAKLPEYVEEDLQVSEWSTVRVKHCAYSVPLRLIGEWVCVPIFPRSNVAHVGTSICSADQPGSHMGASASRLGDVVGV